MARIIYFSKRLSDLFHFSLELLDCYYKAEDYHQDYYRQNQTQGYCMAVIPPKLAKLKAKFGKEMA